MIQFLQWFARHFPQSSSATPASTFARPEGSTTPGATSTEKSSSLLNPVPSSNVVNREAFFSVVRDGLFNGSLSQAQVNNLNILLDTWGNFLPNANPHWIANSMAQIYHETGGRMVPVRETFAESDEQAIARLDRAFIQGQLPWVRTAYWRSGWFGRGDIQLTHRPNYVKMGKRTGYDLVGNPSLMLDPKISKEVAVIGMVEGLFTGKSLSDYIFPDALDAPPAHNPRRIINGPDGTDAKVAALHRKFLKALV
jgi:putative chitinase